MAEREPRIVECASLLHHTDAPIVVGAEGIGRVVFRSQLPPSDEGLVADQHSPGKFLPRQFLGRA